MDLDELSLTKALIAIDSSNPFRTIEVDGRTIGIGRETAIQEFLATILQRNGFKVVEQVVEPGGRQLIQGQEVTVPRRVNIVGAKGTGPSSLLFLGHVDTVDVKAGWDMDPYCAQEQVVDGQMRLYGLGANDMKSGLAAILCGTAAAVPDGVRIKVAFVADEEYLSFGAEALLATSFLDDVSLAVIPEMGESETDPSIQWVGLGRLGRTEYLFEVEGRSCHGSDAFLAPDAVNAVHEAAKLETRVIDYCAKLRRTLSLAGVTSTNAAYLSQHQGGKAVLSVPDRASFIVDRTFLPDEQPEEELAKLVQLTASAQQDGLVDSRARLSVRERPRATPNCRPYLIDPNHPKVCWATKVLSDLGIHWAFGVGRSVADENRLAAKGIAPLIIGPHGGGSHTCAEWVDAESIRRVSRIYRALCEAPPASMNMP